MTSISDDFNRANAASLGASWTDYAIGTAIGVQSNKATPNATNNAASRHNTTMAVTHWAKATVSIGASGDAVVGPMCRADASAFTGYAAIIQRSGATVTAEIWEITAGSIVPLATTAFAGTTGAITLYASGTTSTVLTMVVDGVQLLQTTDSTSAFSTQTRAGLLVAGAQNSATADDFSGSDVATVPLAPTGLTGVASSGQVALSWTAPFNGLASITDYVIEYSLDGTSWSTFSDGTSTATTATVTGLTNGTSYRFRVSATNATGTGATSTVYGPVIPAPQVTPIGAGAQVVSTTSGGTLSPAYPAGYTAVADDVCLFVAAGLHNNASSLTPTAPSGYTQINTRFQEVGTYDLQITAWAKKLTASEAAPTVTVPAAHSGVNGGLSAQLFIFRNVDTTTMQDATAVVSSGAAAASFTPTGITTVTEGAMVVSLVASADDNALGLLAGSEQGYTPRASGASYHTTTGGDHAVGVATRLGAIPALTSQAAAPAQLPPIDNVAGTAYNYRWNGTGVNICIIGTGCRSTHNEFTGRVATGYGAGGLAPGTDNVGHDTGTASCALGTTYGVAKGATLVPVRVLNADPGAGIPVSVTVMLDALAWILTTYGDGSLGRTVVSSSMLGYSVGNTDSAGHTVTSGDITSLTAAWQALYDAGIPCVTAAGNNGNTTPSGTVPMTAPTDVIVVGNANAATLDKSATASYGTFIDIWAIGSGTGTVEATSTNNTASVSNYDGSSEAGPQVAGAIACILQAHPSYTPAQCWQALIDNALTAGSVGTGSTTRLLNTQSIAAGGIGTSIAPTWSETAVGNDAWAGITLALRASTTSATQTLTPPQINSAATLYAPTVTVGAVTVAPPLISSTATLYAPAVVQTVVVALIASSATLYAPTVTPGAVTVAPPQITSSSTLYAATVSAGAVTVAPPVIASTATLYVPTVASGGTSLQPPLIASTETVYAPTVAPGAVTLAAPLIVSTETLYTPTLSTGGTSLAPPQIASTGTLFAPAVTVGAVTLSPPQIASAVVLYAPTVVPSGGVAPPQIPSSTTLYAPTVTPGAVGVSPPLIASTIVLYAPTVTTVVTIVAPQIASTTTLYPPALTTGAATLSPPVIASVTVLYAFIVTGGVTTVTTGRMRTGRADIGRTTRSSDTPRTTRSAT